MKKNKLFVTKPSLPPLKEFTAMLDKTWKQKWLTNNGDYHQQLEKELGDYLGVEHISLFANGTLALITALQALDIRGEVITTPYTFVATSNALIWNKLKPVFVDIALEDGNIDPANIEKAITKRTSAILPVHVYGNPCQVEEIEAIAKRNNLKVIYDAAHAFGVKVNNQSVLNYGDLSILSFHATKVFHTFEGGAIISQSKEMKRYIDDLKNFGFHNETTVVAPGINAKMNELQAAMGILQLKTYSDQRLKRKRIAEYYKNKLESTTGIDFMQFREINRPNYGYLPIFINDDYPISRDKLYEKLKDNNIYARRYFYPLVSEFKPYKQLRSNKKAGLANAVNMADQVICLPIYPELSMAEVQRVCDIIM